MRNEIAIHNKENAFKIAEILIEEDNCVLLSKEEDLYIVNYEYALYSNRNYVVFMDREEFDSKYYEIEEEEDK